MVPGDGGTIAHAQLGFGNGMIMLGTAREDEFGELVKPPSALGGIGSQGSYVIVEDADKHYDRAVATGATPAAIPKATSGASARTIPGPTRSQSLEPSEDPEAGRNGGRSRGRPRGLRRFAPGLRRGAGGGRAGP